MIPMMMWTPDQQRTTPQGRRAAQHLGHIVLNKKRRSVRAPFCSSEIAPAALLGGWIGRRVGLKLLARFLGTLLQLFL